MAERTARQRHYQFPVRIFKEGAYWYADCPDLSLITRDRTQRGAMEALSIQALMYIESRVAAGEEDLILRPPPPELRQTEVKGSQRPRRSQRHDSRRHTREYDTILTYRGGSVAYA